MYILIEAIGGICYMGSCIFNQSRKAMAFGGGFAACCFIAALIDMYGSKDMADIAVATYWIGKRTFQKKDLPL